MLYLKRLYRKIENNTEEAQHQFLLYGWMTFLGYIFFYFYNLYLDISPLYENLPARMVAAFLALGLALYKHWPQRLKFFLPFYWHFTLFYNLPFFFTFTLIMNEAGTAWQLNTLSAFVILIILADWKTTFILIPLGVAAAYISARFLKESIEIESTIALVTEYVIILIYTLAFVYRKEKVLKDKAQSLKTQAATIAHEMRTPLANFTMCGRSVNIIKQSIKKIIIAKDPKDSERLEQELDELQDVSDDIIFSAKRSNHLINLLLSNFKENFDTSKNTELSIQKTIKHSIDDFAFQQGEKEIIHFNMEKDFNCIGNVELLKHIFFNLLKNSLYFIQASGKGEIYISTHLEQDKNIIIFKDTGPGISPQQLPNIFIPFHSQRPHGTGLGLSFCKKAMKSMGGDITVESNLGEHTTFALSFPKIKEDVIN